LVNQNGGLKGAGENGLFDLETDIKGSYLIIVKKQWLIIPMAMAKTNAFQ
jgi:hypothetical protein